MDFSIDCGLAIDSNDVSVSDVNKPFHSYIEKKTEPKLELSKGCGDPDCREFDHGPSIDYVGSKKNLFSYESSAPDRIELFLQKLARRFFDLPVDREI
jgi:hypothetical protein